jgi:hypothetical protein
MKSELEKKRKEKKRNTMKRLAETVECPAHHLSRAASTGTPRARVQKTCQVCLRMSFFQSKFPPFIYFPRGVLFRFVVPGFNLFNLLSVQCTYFGKPAHS